jgi:hypothetical protein
MARRTGDLRGHETHVGQNIQRRPNTVLGDISRIYWPLLERISSEIVQPMITMKLSFDEFVALKALVSWQGGALPTGHVSLNPP